ncbi:uncharacterized protein LOC127131346 [Lathyrus oleraceus]|uniref:uncharacterized protein LOC127131346 n=1 Tax=Pisum sativum TaxID=3888 RepID=UPI0021CEBFAD|nr:uncharacterized protein LOC127131346 [Pisum sativum]
MVRDKMKKAQDRQKSYADHRRRPLEFDEGDHVFLKVTPRLRLKGLFKSQILSTRYIGPYQIIERIGEVAYILALPPSLSEMHDVFHVSQLRKFIPDSLQPILPDSIKVEADLTFEPLPSRIAGREVKVLRNKEIPLVKVQWAESHPGDATWELESEMRDAYSHLFQKQQFQDYSINTVRHVASYVLKFDTAFVSILHVFSLSPFPKTTFSPPVVA